jgi:uncharacterized membrane protein YraQ (UPF0718 family)
MAFLSILFEGAPYILIGTILSGLIDAFLPSKLLERALPKNKVLATFAAGFLGLIFPVCECAIVPVIRRLVQKGLPISCAFTYMLAAPIMNPVVAISTATAFQNMPTGYGILGSFGMTVARLSLGYIVSVLVGLLVLRYKASDLLQPTVLAGGAGHVHEQATSFDGKLVHAMRTAMRDFLDTAMYFTIGVAITSVFNTHVNQAILATVAGNDFLATPSIMSLAIVLSLCSTSDAFIAAPMAVFSSGAKLAFLVFGPMMDIKLMFMYSAVFKRRVVIAMLIGLFVVIGLFSGPWARLISTITSTPTAAVSKP